MMPNNLLVSRSATPEANFFGLHVVSSVSPNCVWLGLHATKRATIAGLADALGRWIYQGRSVKRRLTNCYNRVKCCETHYDPYISSMESWATEAYKEEADTRLDTSVRETVHDLTFKSEAQSRFDTSPSYVFISVS